MKSDIEIAQAANMIPIWEVAEQLNIPKDELEMYGKYKAKLGDELWDRVKDNPDGKLILVTAINPTPAGEGKTTTSVGLGQAMGKLGKKAVIALREPSLGPCFGIKGGAAGGGNAQVVPMEDLNLQCTGDIVVGLGRPVDGVVREDHFIISVASEIMAILCLADNMKDLKERLSRIIVAYNYAGEPVTAGQLNAVGAMAALLKDAIKPNMVQTLENTPALVHGGPFANIAHGCNSVRATKTGLKLADYVITEAGFGADLGAEKFFDIKCRMAGMKPDAVVLVATVRALKYNGGVAKENLGEENLEALKAGIVNLEKHIENVAKFKVPCVVTLNRFVTDTDAELQYIEQFCKERGCDFALSEVWEKGGEGGIALAKEVIHTLETKESDFTPLYDTELSIREKIEKIAKEIYGAGKVNYAPAAAKAIDRLESLGYGDTPICMAKNQYSLSDDPKKLGRPEEFEITIREVYVSAGAGFVVAITGTVMTMPGLPLHPAAEHIDVNEDGVITGLS